MPETQLDSHEPLEGPPSTSNEFLKNADLAALLGTIEADDPTLSDLSSPTTLKLRHRLRSEGGRAATFILDEVTASPGEQGATDPLELLKFCATPEQSGRVTDLLASDPSMIQPLTQTLEYIGTPSNVEALSEHMARLQSDPEPSPDAIAARDQLLRAMSAIAQRTLAGPEKDHLDETVQKHIDSIRATDPQYSPEWLVNDTLPRVLDQRRENFFKVLDNDRDYAKSQPTPTTQDPERLAISHEHASQRLQVLRNLHALGVTPMEKASSDGPDRVAKQIGQLEYLEGAMSDYAPTLGIELEIFEPAVLPPEAQDWTAEQRTSYLEAKKAAFEATRQAGVPSGADGFWEFANSPAQYYGTLPREVESLIDLDLIRSGDQRLPLHLTMGGITTEGDAGREAVVLTRLLEATAWTTTGERITEPLSQTKDSWACKGAEGVMERQLSSTVDGAGASVIDTSIGADIHHAVELRTLQFKDIGGLTRTLRSAYYLGAALRAAQGHREGDPVAQQLGDVWSELSESAGALFSDYGMKNPATSEWETSYPGTRDEKHASNVPMLDASFSKLGELLTDAAADPETLGALFVEEARDIVLTARAKAAAIIEANRPPLPSHTQHATYLEEAA